MTTFKIKLINDPPHPGKWDLRVNLLGSFWERFYTLMKEIAEEMFFIVCDVIPGPAAAILQLLSENSLRQNWPIEDE